MTERSPEADLTALARDNESILQAAGEGIFRVGAEGSVTFANREACRLLGWTAAELIGRPAHETFHHRRRDGTAYPAAECPILATRRTGEVRRVGDEVFWRRNGEPLEVDYTTAPIREGGEVVGAVVVFSDVTRRRKLEERLRHQADHDALTGLLNRRRFEEELARTVRHGRRYGRRGALLLLDLDDFKFLNDSFGHGVGDDMLRGVASVLLEELRESDVAARLGGDEFALLLPEADAEDARSAAQRLLRRIDTLGTGPMLGASVGIAQLGGRGDVSATELLVAADIALYEAKQSGRGKICVFSGGRGESLTWVEQLREAIADDRLLLYSQPIIELGGGEVVSEELLVRMLDHHGDVIPPSAFLPTAERFGLIKDIDLWVVRQAAEHATRGRAFSVNLSARSIGSAEVLATVAAAVEDGLDPTRLTFEITETAAIANLDEARRFAEELHALGCRLALDDFGTGFASFTYLKHMPVGCLKIDTEFVRELAGSEIDRQIVKAIVDTARALGRRTVAEGVEDLATLNLLRRYGVDYAQGYCIGAPAALAGDVPRIETAPARLYAALSAAQQPQEVCR